MISPDLFISELLALALVYLGFSPRVATPLYRPMLFNPAKYPEGNYELDSIDGIKPQDIEFNSADGTSLHGWLFKVPGASKTILFHHGNAANLTTRLGTIQLQLRAGVSVFIYDYRGFGKSQGLPDLRGICDDGCAAFDYLVEREGLVGKNIINYGESLGSGVSCQVSTLRQGGGLILQSGFCSLRKIGGEVAPWIQVYPEFLFPQPALDNIAIVKRHHPPLLVMHGKEDTTVPFRHGQELYAQASEPKSFVQFPTANHNDIAIVDPDTYLTALEQFLASLPQGQPCSTSPPASA